MNSTVKIIGYTENPDRIASCGARISTTAGDSLFIFEKSTDTDKNQKLIRKVLSSGHRTVIEHIYFNLAFVNVSACVEQFMIEFRLASFTVKSRRYVDFSSMGFVVPSFIDQEGMSLEDAEELETLYSRHMSFLFEKYGELTAAGVPKEDARFLLPYAYRSNFYCTVNARELYYILSSMLYERGSKLSEIRSLGRELLNQACEICPFIFEDLSAGIPGNATEQCAADPHHGEDLCSQLARILESAGMENDLPEELSHKQASPDPCSASSPCGPSVELTSYTENPEKAVAKAALITYANLPAGKIDVLLQDQDRVEEIIKMVLSGNRPRELEQVNFTFRINGITLAAITHLTRHRIQSIMIPSFWNVCRCERYMIPDTVKADEKLLEKYRLAFSRTKEVFEILRAKGMNPHELSYLFMSGNVIDITTTMNGRELLTFFALRCCNRAQWETRAIAIKMLNLLREVSPLLFRHFGPSCYVAGRCPEGKMTCGKYAEVQERFRHSPVII